MNFENDIEQSLKVLKGGGIILYPTDTVWGIGCDATNEEAIEKIYQLKQRPENKSLIVLVAEERDVLKYVAAPDLAVFDYLKNSVKPTTVLYNGAIGLAENLPGDDGSIAIRICNDVFCKHLLRRFRKPIVSSSANISGEPTAKFFSEIQDVVRKGVEYIVQYRQDDKSISEPSSIIKWNNGKAEIIRL